MTLNVDRPLNAVLAEILQTGQVTSADGERLQLHSNISLEEGRFLQEVVAAVKPTVSLEVGLAYGTSALFICDALERSSNSRHIVIDPVQAEAFGNIGLNNLKAAGYGELIEFHPLPSYLALPQLVAQGVEIDFAFIDGWHTFDYTLLDFFYVDRLLKVGGMVALDDAHWDSVRRVCRYIVTNRSFSVFRCLPPETVSSKARIKHQLRYTLERAANGVRPLLKWQPMPIDQDLGLVPDSRCIVFKKEAHDSRRWDFHQEF